MGRSSDNPPSAYQDVILDHARSPRHHGATAGVPIAIGRNPLCGDEVTLALVSRDPVALTFESKGCALCRASASILTSALAGMAPDAALGLARSFALTFERGGDPAAEAQAGKELQALRDIRRFPTRVRCVLLPWEAAADLLGR